MLCRWYALIRESEDDLQWLLYKFSMEAQYGNLNRKKQFDDNCKGPVQCRLEVEGKVIEHIISFKYLWYVKIIPLDYWTMLIPIKFSLRHSDHNCDSRPQYRCVDQSGQVFCSSVTQLVFSC